MNYVCLKLKVRDANDASILAAILMDIPGYCGIDEEDTMLSVYLEESGFDESAIRTLLSPFVEDFEISQLPDQNWNALWESNFEPVKILDNLGIRADFHPPFTNSAYDIIITPKMSFGTGHHETTRMMLEFMMNIEFHNKDVLDFGTGTGILAIFASMRGARHIEAIDYDAWSIENAIENCRRNNCANIRVSDKSPYDLTEQYDCILANINLNVLLEYLPQLRTLLKPGGSILLSGILDEDITTLAAKYEPLGFVLTETKQQKNWVALHIN
jgi:ribosomal protein L11 methyltransferase